MLAEWRRTKRFNGSNGCLSQQAGTRNRSTMRVRTFELLPIGLENASTLADRCKSPYSVSPIPIGDAWSQFCAPPRTSSLSLCKRCSAEEKNARRLTLGGRPLAAHWGSSAPESIIGGAN